MSIHKSFYINLKDGRFDGTTPQDMEQMFAQFQNDSRHPTMIVHFHGGLVNEAQGMAIAERLLEEYTRNKAVHPVFFVWEAGLFEVISHNLHEIAADPLFQKLLRHMLRFAKAKLEEMVGMRSGGRLDLDSLADIDAELDHPRARSLPFASISSPDHVQTLLLSSDQLEQFQQEMEEDREFREILEEILESVPRAGERTREGGGSARLLPPHLLVASASVPSRERGVISSIRLIKAAVSVLVRVVSRYAQKRDHGLYATVVEEILREFYLAHAGRIIWEAMKKDTEDAFQSGDTVHGGTAFLTHLAQTFQVYPDTRVLLVGHSTGAVYISNFLRHAATVLPEGACFDIALLAPAVTFAHFHETVTGAAGQRIRSLRIFGMQDNVEKADRLVPVLYPHSLLYFVSGVVEQETDMPLLGMERYHSASGPYDRREIREVLAFCQTRNASMVWSQTREDAEPGFRSQATKHGDFDDDGETIASILTMI